MDLGGNVRVSGAMLLNHRQAMCDILGGEMVGRALAKMPADQRSVYESLTPLSWCPLEVAEAAVTTVASEAGRDLMAFHAEATRVNLMRTFTTIWRLLLRVTTDSALVSRTPVLYARTFDRGALTSEIVSPGRAKIAVRGWRTITALQVEGLRVGVETVLQLAGRRDVKVVPMRTGDGVEFTALWR